MFLSAHPRSAIWRAKSASDGSNVGDPQDPEDEIDWQSLVTFMREAETRSRGYASYWEWAPDRQVEEIGVVRTLATFLTFTEGSVWRSIEPVANDPPDVLLTRADGRRIGVEVTELVSGEAAKLHRHRKKTGEGSPYAWANWTADSVAQAISGSVRTKDRKLAPNAGAYDDLILAIATDEPMITLELAQQALRACQPKAQALDHAFLVISYHPETDKSLYPAGCPVLPIALHR